MESLPECTVKIVKVSGIIRTSWSDFSLVPTIAPAKSAPKDVIRGTGDGQMVNILEADDAKPNLDVLKPEYTPVARPVQDALAELDQQLKLHQTEIKLLCRPWRKLTSSFLPSSGRAKKHQLLLLRSKVRELKAQKKALKATMGQTKRFSSFLTCFWSELICY